ncbi:MAG: ABC transporter substrate-binding protein [Bacteriovoracia bacterium]
MKPIHFLTLLCLTTFFSSCNKEANTNLNELNLISTARVAGFDPNQASDVYVTNEMGKVYEGLYEFHPFKKPYELIPNLAEKLPQASQDGLTYTFTIKKGVLFHDDECFPDKKGREVKASDFIYSFKRIADPKSMSKGWWLFDGRIKGLNEWREKNSKAETTNYQEDIEGLKLVDDYTFQVKLVKPYPQFLYSLAMAYTFVIAKEAVDHYGKEFLNHPVGTGPFILPVFDQSNKIVYQRNPKFREKFFPSDDPALAKLKVPLLDTIKVHIMPESQPKWFSFNKAKVDVLEIPKDFFQQAVESGGKLSEEMKEKGVKLVSAPMLDVTFYAFNHDDPLFKNKKLRQAMSLAYNRGQSNKLFYNDTAKVAHGAIPPGLSGYEESFKNPYVEHNIKKAKELLKEAGYPEGKGLPEITVQTTGETVSRQMLEFFAKCMSDIGIRIKIGTNTWPELVNKVSKRQHQMYTMAWYADYPDAENFLGLLYCPNQAPGSNGSNYCNPKFDALFKKASVLPDSPERTRLYQEMNAMVAEESPWILGFHRTRHYLHYEWLQHFHYTEFTHTLFQYLGVDKELKEKNISNF